MKTVDLQELIDSYDGTPKTTFSRGKIFEDADKIIYKNKEFELIGVQRSQAPVYCLNGFLLDESVALDVCLREKAAGRHYYVMRCYLSGRWEGPELVIEQRV